jgi:hypothetical protein
MLRRYLGQIIFSILFIPVFLFTDLFGSIPWYFCWLILTSVIATSIWLSVKIGDKLRIDSAGVRRDNQNYEKDQFARYVSETMRMKKQRQKLGENFPDPLSFEEWKSLYGPNAALND